MEVHLWNLCKIKKQLGDKKKTLKGKQQRVHLLLFCLPLLMQIALLFLYQAFTCSNLKLSIFDKWASGKSAKAGLWFFFLEKTGMHNAKKHAGAFSLPSCFWNLNAICSSPLSKKCLYWLCFASWRFTTQPNLGIDFSVPHDQTSNTASVFVLYMERWQSHKQVLCRGVGHRCQLQSKKKNVTRFLSRL